MEALPSQTSALPHLGGQSTRASSAVPSSSGSELPGSVMELPSPDCGTPVSHLRCLQLGLRLDGQDC
eukprot:8571734-Alexandrium_andersonii.AAC.1